MPVAFISGAGQGIGRAIALSLADDGFDIAVNDMPSKDVSSAVKEILDKGRKAIAAPADVTSAEAVETAVAETVQQLGSLDVMVANAGILILAPLLEVTQEQFAKIVAVNIGGVLNCFQSAGKQMIKQGRGGRLIAASSAAGKKSGPLYSVYSATKFAVRGLTIAAAAELGKHGITANCYCPTFVETPMTVDPATGKVVDGMAAHCMTLPIPRVGRVEDVANVVSFLASEKSSYITGQSLSVDGGEASF